MAGKARTPDNQSTWEHHGEYNPHTKRKQALKYRQFTKEEKEILLNEYPSKGTRLWEERFKDDFPLVNWRARVNKMGLAMTDGAKRDRLASVSLRLQTPENLEFITRNYGGMSVAEIAKHLKCSTETVLKVIHKNDIQMNEKARIERELRNSKARGEKGGVGMKNKLNSLQSLCSTCDNCSPLRCKKVRSGKGEWTEGILIPWGTGDWNVIVIECPTCKPYPDRKNKGVAG